MVTRLPESERRWLRALLVLGTITVALILTGIVANLLVYFSDVLLILILAWLFAFILSPLVTIIQRTFPAVSRTIVVVAVYAVLFVVLSGIVLLVAGTLATSIGGFIADLPTLQTRLPELLAPWQSWISSLGFNVNLVVVANEALQGLVRIGGDLVKPLTDLALASLGVLGNMLLVVFLSLFIVIDKDRMLAFVNRVIPPRWSDEASLFETSVSQSFGGFLRGQAIQGVIYGAIALGGSLIFGIPYAPATTALVAILQMIPFFGPFVSWAPPVVAAALTNSPVLPILIVMIVGWFIVMNIVQPRVMASAVGIHPVVVLVSVLIGLKLQGIVGAIFAIPVAAVISSFFFFYLNRSAGGERDVTSRATRRVEAREGRPVRKPEPPAIVQPGPADGTAGGAPSSAATPTASAGPAAPEPGA